MIQLVLYVAVLLALGHATAGFAQAPASSVADTELQLCEIAKKQAQAQAAQIVDNQIKEIQRLKAENDKLTAAAKKAEAPKAPEKPAEKK